MRPRYTTLIVALACGLGAVGAGACTRPRPNIVLLMGDDHGWEETAYNGHPHLRTPVLDEMAAIGLRMDRFYSAAPNCSPTRGSVITGRHPNRYGTFAPNWSIRPEEVSVARILRDAGYACGHFGKWHLGPVKATSPTSPGAMGFERWLSHDNFFEIDPRLSRDGGPPEPFRGESSEIVVDETIRFIGEAKRSGRPFFAVVWFGSPHEPYSGSDADLALYDELPESYRRRFVTVTGMDTGLPVRRPLDGVLRERFAEITAMDRAIGRLRRYLDDARLRERTLLWYFGDNGVPPDTSATTPLRGHKGLLYEGGVRVPGVIEWPERIIEPRATDVVAVSSDVLPTICDLLDLPLPDRPLDGISLAPLIEGTMASRPSPVHFWSFDASRELERGLEPYIEPRLQEGTTPLVKLLDGRLTRTFRNLRHLEIDEQRDFAGPRAILQHRYKLVIDGRPGAEPGRELFDMLDDPAEQVDLAEAKPDVARDLERQLRAWQRSVLESLIGADYR